MCALRNIYIFHKFSMHTMIQSYILYQPKYSMRKCELAQYVAVGPKQSILRFCFSFRIVEFECLSSSANILSQHMFFFVFFFLYLYFVVWITNVCSSSIAFVFAGRASLKSGSNSFHVCTLPLEFCTRNWQTKFLLMNKKQKQKQNIIDWVFSWYDPKLSAPSLKTFHPIRWRL